MFILRGSQWMISLSNSAKYTKSSDFSNIQQITCINSIYRYLSVMLSIIGGRGRGRERRTMDNSKHSEHWVSRKESVSANRMLIPTLLVRVCVITYRNTASWNPGFQKKNSICKTPRTITAKGHWWSAGFMLLSYVVFSLRIKPS